MYLFLKNGKEAAEHLKMALEIRREYGIFETHDTLQQLMNLTNMLILAKDYDLANQALSLYESLVLEHEGDNNFDKKTQICRNCHKRHTEFLQKIRYRIR